MQRRQLIAAMAGLFFGTALAQPWPDRPIRLIVPFAAGGGTDTAARIVMKKVGEQLGQPVVVENKAGAGGAVAFVDVLNAKADGYTLTIGSAHLPLLNLLNDRLPFNAATDLVSVAPLANVPIALVASKRLPVKNMSELIAYAKSNPGLGYGTPGATTTNHLAGVLLASMAGIELTHVPYKGTAPAASDVVGGHLPLAIIGLSTALSFARNGQLLVLGVGGAKRSELAPEVPTIAEGGVKGFEAGYWYDITAARGVPQPVLDRLHTEISKAVQSPEVRAALIDAGLEPMVVTPAENKRLLRAEAAKWERVIKTHNIRSQ